MKEYVHDMKGKLASIKSMCSFYKVHPTDGLYRHTIFFIQTENYAYFVPIQAESDEDAWEIIMEEIQLHPNELYPGENELKELSEDLKEEWIEYFERIILKRKATLTEKNISTFCENNYFTKRETINKLYKIFSKCG